MPLAAIYIRVSTQFQAEEGYSLAAQEKSLRENCAMSGYDVYRTYADEGKSGKDMENRPALQEMIRDAEERKFDRILVWKLTRLTRSLTDLCEMSERLEQAGVALVSATEPFDTSTPAGRMMRNFLGTIAQWERETIAENTRVALAERASQGARTCGEILGYDLIPHGGMEINEEGAAIVRLAFRKYIEIGNLNEVSRWLKAEGIKGKRGGDISPAALKKLLVNRVYIGEYNYKGLTNKGEHTPIISLNMFKNAQRILKKNSRKSGRKKKK